MASLISKTSLKNCVHVLSSAVDIRVSRHRRVFRERQVAIGISSLIFLGKNNVDPCSVFKGLGRHYSFCYKNI